MANSAPPFVPMGNSAPVDAALQHSSWRKHFNLSSGVARLEAVLEASGFDRAPWLVVAYAGGIAAWFVLANTWQWLALLTACAAVVAGALAGLRAEGRYPFLRQALIVMPGLILFGCLTVWGKSELIGSEPVAGPVMARFDATIVSREEQPAEERVRLVIDTREPKSGRAIRVRVNLPLARDRVGLASGSEVKLRARVMPPAPPMLPGSYDFARAAWFNGLAATGTVLGEVEVVRGGDGGGGFGSARAALAEHVRGRLAGSAGTIAAAFASGDRGAIAETDEEAMRDSGLTHLLSVSGLHVSAVVAAGYLITLKLLALWPWLALRVRLPLTAAGAGALAGIGYTLLTGAEVPTVRSCIGAVLVLIALALGREALSMRMVAVAAFAVLLLWPEALVGPSFQMSFAAVIAIVALHGAAPIKRFLLPRAEPWWTRGLRQLAMLLGTGVVIEFALMPIGLFHFHRAGVYGALANVVAIPLTTFVSMPLIALALVFDGVGAGAPFWWCAGKSLDLLLGLAHWTAGQPGAVTLLPAFGAWPFALSLAGLLWLALWRGRKRLLGLVPVALGTLGLALASPPDVLVSGDGKHIGIAGEVPGELLVLRESRSDYARDNLTEQAGMDGELRKLDDWPGAVCTREFCSVTLRRGGRDWHLLLGRGTDYVEERALAAGCERADIVISDRWLPRSCRPRWFKADRALLGKTGGLAIDLQAGEVRTVAEGQGEHGWWHEPPPRPPRKPRASGTQSAPISPAKATPAPAQ